MDVSTVTKKMDKTLTFHGVGRRKSSVARAWLTLGKGIIEVNGREFKEYFTTEPSLAAALLPLKIHPKAQHYNVKVNVTGGGFSGQADAVKLAIARALLEADENARGLLREHGLLTSDARLKERKKYGQKAARRKFQFVKR